MTEVEERAVSFIEGFVDNYCITSSEDIECPYIKDLYIAVMLIKEV